MRSKEQRYPLLRHLLLNSIIPSRGPSGVLIHKSFVVHFCSRFAWWSNLLLSIIKISKSSHPLFWFYFSAATWCRFQTAYSSEDCSDRDFVRTVHIQDSDRETLGCRPWQCGAACVSVPLLIFGPKTWTWVDFLGQRSTHEHRYRVETLILIEKPWTKKKQLYYDLKFFLKRLY